MAAREGATLEQIRLEQDALFRDALVVRDRLRDTVDALRQYVVDEAHRREDSTNGRQRF